MGAKAFPKNPPRAPAGAAHDAPIGRRLLSNALSDLAVLSAQAGSVAGALIRLGGEDESAVTASSLEPASPAEFPHRFEIPIFDSLGIALGNLVLVDANPIAPDATQARLLRGLAGQAAALFELAENLGGSEERSRAFVEHSPLPAWARDGWGRYPFANPALRADHGSAREGGDPSRLHDFPTAADRERFEATDRQVLDEGGTLTYLERTVMPDGTPRVRRIVKFPLAGRDGLPWVGGFAEDLTEREALESRTRLFESLFRAIPVGIFVWKLERSPAGEVEPRLAVSNAAAEITGSPRPETIAGRTMREIFPEAFASGLPQRCAQAAASGKIVDLGEAPCGDGSRRRTARIIPLSEDTVAVAFEDVTEEMRYREVLRHSEERYRTLASISPVGLYRVNTEGRWTFVNEHVCGLLAVKPDQILGGDASAVLHPADAGWVTELWNRAAAENRPFHAEYRLLARDGRVVWVMGKALADRGPDGAPVGFVGTVTDITEHKQTETLLDCQKRTLALIAAGQSLPAVLESLVAAVERESAGGMGAVLLAEGPDAEFSWAARAALPAELALEWGQIRPGPGGPLGLAAERGGPVYLPDFEAGDDRNTAAIALRHGIRACAARPIKGPRGEIQGVFAFFYPRPGEIPPYDARLMEVASDLAAIAVERHRQEEVARSNQALQEQNMRVMEASRMKSEFLANMSHELRTPLNAIIGFSQLLVDRKVGPLNEKQSEYIGDILDGGMHLLRLINDVLDLAKIEAGKMQLHREEMSVAQAMREVCDILVPMAMGKSVTVRHEAAPGAATALLDPHKVRQVLYNLVSNAIKFSRTGGRVDVLSRADGMGGIVLRVADHGIGIRKEDLGKLFQQFQQLDSGSARFYPGTGLGLVITKKLVELHGGTVSVDSEPGVGSVFTAHFPALADEED